MQWDEGDVSSSFRRSTATGGAVGDLSLRARLWRAVPPCLAIVLVSLALAEFSVLSAMPVGRLLWAVDITGYLDATHRWLATGTPYLTAEVDGPFAFGPNTFLHPPIALYLFAPFIALPLAAWWLIPAAIVAVSVATWRPDRWFWPLAALCLLWPRTQVSLLFGNTDMWVTAFVALALRFGWPGLLVVIKPSFAFLMFVGSTSRSWWLGLWILAIAAVPLGHLWLDWLAVVRNAPAGLDYSLTSLPMVLIPIAGWLCRTTPAADVAMVPAVRATLRRLLDLTARRSSTEPVTIPAEVGPDR
jgi:hypothetical protein